MKHALMPHNSRPKFIDGHPHWIVRSADGAKLATLYTSDINGHGADFSAEVGGSLTCRSVPGGPCLPLTNPSAVPPLAWTDVAAEVGAMLAADGWTVCWPVSDPVTDAPVWSDQEADFLDAVADHAYAEGRTDSVRDFAAERDALRACAAKWEDAAQVWRTFAVDVAGVTGARDPDDVGIEDLRGLAGAVERLRAFALEVALQVAPLGEEQRAAQTTVRDLPAVTEALREVVAERDRADQRADRAYARKVVAENDAAALRARAEAAEAALATARAEGAAAERAAVVRMLRADLGSFEVVNADADDYVRDLVKDIEDGVHTPPRGGRITAPVEGA